MSLLLFYFLAVSLVAPAAVASHSPPQRVIQEEKGKLLFSPIRDALVGASIIPDVLDDFTPTFALLIAYPSTHTSINLGSYVSPDAVHSQPIFEFHSILDPPNQNQNQIQNRIPVLRPLRPEKLYSIILTDPDAKSRRHPIWSEMCHWIVSNISSPGLVSLHPQAQNRQQQEEEEEEKVDGTACNPLIPSYLHAPQILKSYLPPSPPPGTDYHRYVFVLLEGDAATAYNISAPKKRKHWGYGGVRRGVRDWATEYGLEAVGASFFYARAGDDERVIG
ncbi:hypothetical protein AJ78_00275 [Emergomyces pasteurianus Ep9510]|uniref:YbhB/YbcL family Raf kinase inhibitor-like protein n=1 Tax=Emergomyces pasteurianus Ep9510 TaxID=1447872 RepID=A0A1J9PTQ3_9EURO|nr:hypothetical protein AJ78_00275 [Emergomyces pasteurianus Ep9510]